MNPQSMIGDTVKVIVDRPMGSRHPEHGFLYPINYGYIPDTTAADGDGLDAYILGIFEPLSEYEGNCIAVIHRLNDDDDKLVVCPSGKIYSDEQIIALTEFQEQFFVSTIERDEFRPFGA